MLLQSQVTEFRNKNPLTLTIIQFSLEILNLGDRESNDIPK